MSIGELVNFDTLGPNKSGARVNYEALLDELVSDTNTHVLDAVEVVADLYSLSTENHLRELVTGALREAYDLGCSSGMEVKSAAQTELVAGAKVDLSE